jgi:hypothetical protein
MRIGPGSAYDKWNIFVVICDIDNSQPSHGGEVIIST